jgi:hypothetical protein
MNLTALPSADREPTIARPRAIGRTADERFRQSGYLALRNIRCVAEGGAVHLHGRLPSHYLKQVAQEIAFGLEGVSRVVNRIEVLRAGSGIPRPTARSRDPRPTRHPEKPIVLSQDTTTDPVRKEFLAEHTTHEGSQ